MKGTENRNVTTQYYVKTMSHAVWLGEAISQGRGGLWDEGKIGQSASEERKKKYIHIYAVYVVRF